ncbi:MAG: nucleoside 2-deoxyribosyltransferase [Candidatus Pacebacteria bacterium]|nr:nucleoside 2-deoxyribosyltransferase [Candidatus Paceibacterota bacterium]
MAKSKILLSFRYTGENIEEVKETMQKIGQSLAKAGFENFCSFEREEFFKENNFTKRQILEYTLKELDACDYILAFIRSEEKSEGMLLEIGFGLAKNKKLILAIKKGAKTVFLHDLAEQVIEFETLDDLYARLEKYAL